MEQERIKLDYSLETAEERKELVNKIIESTPKEELTSKYLEALANYLVIPATRKERAEKNVLTDNIMVTVNKRERSFQGLAAQLENGEDGIYNMIANDKNIIFSPKISITEQDLKEIPGLRELAETIAQLQEQQKTATGKKRFLLKQQIKNLSQDQYELRAAYRKPIYCMNLIKTAATLKLDEHITINPKTGLPESDGLISFFNTEHISALLRNYSALKENCYDALNSDIRWLMEDLDTLVDKALKDKYPLYYKILIYKIDGKQNVEIQSLLEAEFNITHSVEYISSLWRNKIPKLIVEEAQKEYLIYYYTHIEEGQWKTCSRCGEKKLAHSFFFSKNKTSKDGFYSICKCCRNKKTKSK